MDNSRFGIPSKEWTDFAAAHPDLDIDEDGFHDSDFPSIHAFRDAGNAAKEKAAREFIERDGLAAKVATQDYRIPTRDGSTITLRRYRPASTAVPAQGLPAYVFFHGGGMLFGTTEGEAYSCSTWTHKLATAGEPIAFLHVCYRHTPDFTHPHQHEDAWDAFEWIITNAPTLGVDVARIVIGGVSAGGHLAASVVFHEVGLARREGGRRPRVAGQLLVIPWLILRDAYPLELFASPEKASLLQCVDSPTLPKPRYDAFTDLYKAVDVRDPLSNVGLAAEEDLAGTPRTAIIVTGRDLLRDEAFIYATKLERTGCPVKKHIFSGLPHAFRKHADLPSSKRWDELTLESIRWCLDNNAEGDTPGEWKTEIPEQYR